MTEGKVKLKSSDDEIIEVATEVAKVSLTIKTMMETIGGQDASPIPLPNLSTRLLRKLIQWMEYHVDDPQFSEDENEEDDQDDETMTEWDQSFLNVDHDHLCEIIQAANYLDVKGLLDISSQALRKILKELTVQDVRRKFRIQNDFTPDEEKQLRKDNAWIDSL